MRQRAEHNRATRRTKCGITQNTDAAVHRTQTQQRAEHRCSSTQNTDAAVRRTPTQQRAEHRCGSTQNTDAATCRTQMRQYAEHRQGNAQNTVCGSTQNNMQQHTEKQAPLAEAPVFYCVCISIFFREFFDRNRFSFCKPGRGFQCISASRKQAPGSHPHK